MNLAQAEAFHAMRAVSSDGMLGTAFSMSPCEPATDSAADAAAAERFHRFINTWSLEPVLTGRYPEAYLDGVPLAAMGVQNGDLERVRAPLDFIGINLYSRTLVANAPDDPHLGAFAVGPLVMAQYARHDILHLFYPT